MTNGPDFKLQRTADHGTVLVSATGAKEKLIRIEKIPQSDAAHKHAVYLGIRGYILYHDFEKVARLAPRKDGKIWSHDLHACGYEIPQSAEGVRLDKSEFQRAHLLKVLGRIKYDAECFALDARNGLGPDAGRLDKIATDAEGAIAGAFPKPHHLYTLLTIMGDKTVLQALAEVKAIRADDPVANGWDISDLNAIIADLEKQALQFRGLTETAGA